MAENDRVHVVNCACGVTILACISDEVDSEYFIDAHETLAKHEGSYTDVVNRKDLNFGKCTCNLPEPDLHTIPIFEITEEIIN